MARANARCPICGRSFIVYPGIDRVNCSCCGAVLDIVPTTCRRRRRGRPIQPMPNGDYRPIQPMPNGAYRPIQSMPNAGHRPIQPMPNGGYRPIQQPMPNAGRWPRPPPLIRVAPKKKALLCGVSYKNMPYELKGCVSDVNWMKYMLNTRFNFPEESIVVLTEEEQDPYKFPTKRNIQKAMRWLVQDCEAGDSLVFYFSGHGSQQIDYMGEEADGYNETLCPVDFEKEGIIVDNEINNTLVRPLPLGVRLHAIVDSCHSGTILDLPYLCWLNKEGECVWEDHSPLNGAWKGTSGGEAMSFSGCNDDQTSADTKALAKITSTGAMTCSFIKAIENGEGKTYGSLLRAICENICKELPKHKDQSGDNYKKKRIQEPQFSSSFPFDLNDRPFYL